MNAYGEALRGHGSNPRISLALLQAVTLRALFPRQFPRRGGRISR